MPQNDQEKGQNGIQFESDQSKYGPKREKKLVQYTQSNKNKSYNSYQIMRKGPRTNRGDEFDELDTLYAADTERYLVQGD